MPKTVVGLFENPGLADDVVREIEALGFPRKEVRTLDRAGGLRGHGCDELPTP